jgi:hypothetical protein
MSGSQPEQEQSKIVQLLLRLQEDFKLLTEFNEDPDDVMVEAGILSEEDRNTLKSGDIMKIRQLLAKKESEKRI